MSSPLYYPQLPSGALVQYPFTKERLERTILNVLQDGSTLALWDEFAPQVRWRLVYEDLSDSEVALLTSFFSACEGRLQPFLFVDPAANILLFSEDLTQPVWNANSELTFAGGIGDPFGGNSGTQVTNGSGAALAVSQTVEVPGAYFCAFSAFVRCSQPGSTVTLTRSDGNNSTSQVVTATAAWNRFSVASSYASSSSVNCEFSLSFPPGAVVDVFGFQVDAQPFAGTYMPTAGISNVYPAARFDMDQLQVLTTGPSRHNLQIAILSQASQ